MDDVHNPVRCERSCSHPSDDDKPNDVDQQGELGFPEHPPGDDPVQKEQDESAEEVLLLREGSAGLPEANQNESDQVLLVQHHLAAHFHHHGYECAQDLLRKRRHGRNWCSVVSEPE